jgi:type II secretory pathway component GspD/PulD (secretin)
VFNSAAAVSSFNIGAILDALETQGLSRRVDDGSITVLDNQTGTIQSGGTIFISIPGASENIEREIPYGVQLEITPRVANDGSVTLSIVARVEDVLSTTNDPSFLNLSTRAVNSTINLQPGQTALLGGLMQSNFTMSKRRVPVLGAIPIIGELFGSTVSEDTKSDLLLIVTSQVID